MPINVMMYGPKGAGKSSLINSFVTCLSLENRPIVARIVAKQSDHVTNEYEMCPILQFLQGHATPPSVPFVFWDLWGYSETDFKGISIKHFLKGMVPDKQQRLNTKGNPIDSADIDGTAALSREIMVLVFVLPLSAILDGSVWSHFRTACSTAIGEKYLPILVVTASDTISNVKQKKEDQDELLSKCGLDAANVYFHTNYTSERNRDIDKDLSTRRLLTAIFNR